MTQTSYFHNGLTQGDATLAPYDAEALNTAAHIGKSGAKSFVSTFHSYGGLALRVTADGVNHRVTIASGWGMVDGIVYNNSSSLNVTLADAHASLPRWDRVVLRADYQSSTGQYTVRVKIINGVPAVVPSKPEITQVSGYVYEIPLASVYVEAGVVPIYQRNVHDERTMYDMQYPLGMDLPETSNMAINGAWMSSVEAGIGGAPAWWGTTLTAATDITFENIPLIEGFPKGQNIKVTFNDTDNLFHNGNGQKFARNTDRWVTIWFKYKVEGGAIAFYVDGGTTEQVRLHPTTDGYNMFVFRYKFTSGDQDCMLAFKALSDDSVLYLSPITITYGTQVIQPYNTRQETVMFWIARESDWIGNVVLGEDFILDGLKSKNVWGTISYVFTRSTGSAGNSTCIVYIRKDNTSPDSIVAGISGITNLHWRYGIGICPVKFQDVDDDNLYEYTQYIGKSCGASSMSDTAVYEIGVIG